MTGPREVTVLVVTVLTVLLAMGMVRGEQQNQRGYVFTVPKRLLAGELGIGCVSLHGALEAPADLVLELRGFTGSSGNTTGAANGSTELLGRATTSLGPGGKEACLELRVAANTKYTIGRLRLKMTFKQHPDYIVDAEKRVLIEHDALVSFIETDRLVYKPGETVGIRVLSLRHDLRPWSKPIPRLWIENPAEVRVAQWVNVTTTNGLAQLVFPLSPEPSPGTWRIRMEKNRPQFVQTAQFQINKYVLPRFQVTIHPPAYILADAENVTWTVCARYSYGEPVKGTLSLSLRPQTPIWKRKQSVPEVNRAEKFESSQNACKNYTFTADLLGLPHWKIAPSSIVLAANLTESGSGATESALARTPVTHQPLKLEFVPYSPRRFKPGLPYSGRLRVLGPDGVTPAPGERIQVCLRVRLRHEWQRRAVECRNFSSADPEGFLEFTVPPQPPRVLLLSLVATAPEYPTKYYSPDKRWRVFVDQPSAYLDVEPWFSPSLSFLELVRSAHQELRCDESYTFRVLHVTENRTNGGLSDPVTLHYAINARGNLLVFGRLAPSSRIAGGSRLGGFPNLLGMPNSSQVVTHPRPEVFESFELNVKISPAMAPVAEILVYYVRSDGEVVTASHSMRVGRCFANNVRASWRQARLSPGSKAQFEVHAAPDSLCGISAVDKASGFLKSGPSNLMSIDAAFERLASFHLDADTPPIQAIWSHCAKIDRPSDDPDQGAEEEMDHIPLPQPAAASVTRPSVRRKRSRDRIQDSKNQKSRLKLTFPITAKKSPVRLEIRRDRERRSSVTYNADANYVDAIQAFDDFGAVVMSDLTLETRPCPPRHSFFHHRDFIMLNRGLEQDDEFEPARLFKAVKAMPLAYQFARNGIPGEGESSVDGGYAEPGSVDFRSTVTLRSYFPETWLWELVPVGANGSLSIERQLPDSITEWTTNTMCVSARSGLGISTASQIAGFQPFFLDYGLPYSAKRGEVLHLKVSLFNYLQHSIPVRIVLEGHSGLDLAITNQSLKASFCVGARDSVGHEFQLVPRQLGDLNVTVFAEIDSDYEAEGGCGPELLIYTSDRIVKPVRVEAEGFPVQVTNSAFVCPKDFADDASLSWELVLPGPEEQLVEGSVRAQVSVIGDVFGPALDNLDKLVRLPMGCGEQNMILFVPNVHAITYLDAVNRQTSTELRAKALRNMEKGYQRELNYRHPDGSYSAFGTSDETGSMWLTAFVVKSFAQARNLVQIDERDLKLSVKWIVRRQLENGCFPVVGQVFHKDMKGGLREEDGSSSALTAYVLIALLESGVPLTAALVNNALYCLEKASASDQFAESPYTSALTTYALALLEHPRANESLKALMGRATRQNGLLWWEDSHRAASVGLSIEMTSYAVLSLIKLGGEANMLDALRAIRWMSKKRNAEGGFSSTQDTVIGLEALTKYATAMANASATELSVLVTAQDVDNLFKINHDNRMVLQRTKLPVIPTTLEVFAEGHGCVLVQSTVRYNRARATGSEAFDLSASVETVQNIDLDNLADDCAQQKLGICARYKLADEESNMAVVEVALVTGFSVERSSLQQLLNEPTSVVKRYEVDRGNVAIYFEKLTSQKTCISFMANRDNVVENVKPGNIKLYDYYQQELAVTTTYHFAEACERSSKKTEALEGQAQRLSPAAQREPLARIASSPSKDVGEDEVEPPPRPANIILDAKPTVTRDKKSDPVVITSDLIYAVLTTMTPMINNVTPIEVQPRHSVVVTQPEGSGLHSPESADLEDPPGNLPPAFVNVDHDLQTPEGIEGPVPIYVEAPSTGATAIEKSESCPRCDDKLPEDFREVYCAAQGVLKVAVRRNRRVRLLLDLGKLGGNGRLRSMIELELSDGCTCPALDNDGTLALLLTQNSEQKLAQYADRSQVILDRSNSIFTIPLINGIPVEVMEARTLCR